MLLEAGEDVFLTTSALEQNGMLVASMDRWREYFQEYPDENHMRPMLAGIYANLRLDNLRDREARLYQSQLAEE